MGSKCVHRDAVGLLAYIPLLAILPCVVPTAASRGHPRQIWNTDQFSLNPYSFLYIDMISMFKLSMLKCPKEYAYYGHFKGALCIMNKLIKRESISPIYDCLSKKQTK